jgi:hypothetical protein
MMLYSMSDALLRGHALSSSVAFVGTGICPETRSNQELAGRPQKSRRW